MGEKDFDYCDTVEVHRDLLEIVNRTMPDETELYDLAELFKVFGDSTRIRILFSRRKFACATLPRRCI